MATQSTIVSAQQSNMRGTSRPSALAVLVFNHKLKFPETLDGQVAWLGTLEDAVHQGSRPAIIGADIDTKAH